MYKSRIAVGISLLGYEIIADFKNRIRHWKY